MRLTVVGCGDAFGSGGRFNACFLLHRDASDVLLDCGATSLVALRRLGLDPGRVGSVLISHLHGDHFGGLPFLVLDAQFISRREAPLRIVGPPGLAVRLETLMEAMYPGFWAAEQRFRLDLQELAPGASTYLGDGLDVSAIEVAHPSGAPSLGLRLTCDGRVLAYTGDTEWTDALLDLGRGADLLICECSTFALEVRSHLSYATLREKLPLMGAKRVLLTHMSVEMLARLDEVEGCELAEDGLVVEVG